MTLSFRNIAAFVLMLALLAGCSTSPEAKRDKYLARGKAAVARKDYSRAILEFKSAARAMPKDAEAYYQLGAASIAVNDVKTGYAALRNAVALNPKHRGAQLMIAQLLSLTSDPEMLKDAEGRLRALLDGTSETPEVLNTLAFTELKLGRTEDAIRSYEQTLAQYPGELNASLMLARARLSQGDAKAAEDILKKACEQAPKSADARRVLAEFYIARNNLPAAETELKAALGLDAKNGPSLLDLGRLYVTMGRNPEADEKLKQLTSIEGYQQYYGLFLLDQGRNDDAVREFERLAKADPDDRESRTRLVAVYRRLGRLADAQKVLAQALSRNPKDADALLQRGEIALEAGKFDDAEADFNRALKMQPTAGTAHYLVAKLHEARGDKRLYRQELGEALRLSPWLEAVRVELAQELIKQNDPKGALDVLDAAPGSQKESTPVLIQRNWAFWAMGNMAEMRRGIDLVLSRGPSTDALLQDGVWKLRSKNQAGAKASLDAALKLDPGDIRALDVIRQSYMAQNQPAQAVEKVKEYARKSPQSAPVQQFLGSLLMVYGDPKEARAALASANSADPNFIPAYFSLAQLDVTEKKFDDAEARLHKVLSIKRGDSTARLWLAHLDVTKGRHEEAMRNYLEVVTAEPDNAEALNNLAYLTSEYAKRPDEALKYAQRAKELAPNVPAYFDTLGWILYRKGLFPSAVTELQRVASGQSDPVWKYHLAMAYAKAGDTTRGRATLALALKQNPNLPEAKEAQEILGQLK